MQAFNELTKYYKKLGLHDIVNSFDELNLTAHFEKYPEYKQKRQEGTEYDLSDKIRGQYGQPKWEKGLNDLLVILLHLSKLYYFVQEFNLFEKTIFASVYYRDVIIIDDNVGDAITELKDEYPLFEGLDFNDLVTIYKKLLNKSEDYNMGRFSIHE